MKKFFYWPLMLAFLSYLSAEAQKLEIKWGPELEDYKGTNIQDFIGKTSDHFYALRYKPGGYFSSETTYLDGYDIKTMNRVYSNEIEFPANISPDLPKKLELSNVFMLKDKMLMYSTYRDKKEDANKAYCNSINTATGKTNPDMKLIDEIKDVKRRNRGGFSYALSNDSTKFLFYHDEPYEKNQPDRYSAQLLGPNLEKDWSKNFQLNEIDRNVVLSGFDIDQDGTFYQLVKIIERTEGGKKIPDHKWQIISYRNKEDQTKIYDLKIGEKFITDIRFEIDKKGDLVCAGFYSDRNKTSGKGNVKYDRANGIFYLKIDKATQNVKASVVKEFDKSVIIDVMDSEKKASKEDELFQFDVNDFIFREDGGMMMIAEQYWMNQVCYTDSKGNTRCNYHYYYNTILVSNFNEDGSVKWMKAINKLQHTVNDRGMYSSYFKMVSGDKLYFIYNDNPKNIGTTDGSKRYTMSNPKKSITMLAVIDGDSKVQVSDLFKNKELETICKPKIAYQANETEGYLFAEKKSNYRFGRITIQ